VCESAGMDAETLRMRLNRLRRQSAAQVACPVAA
jgi:hypothetical protein